ncbi:hypothetical protein EB796_015983 [Bugula neritina]|uniref:Uncharacterized protein n=1 Tax=Bugula neritina TaxID=10212 RepID=A0A7J7JHB2_BUGNE|nr:hypothetical protein EB796_015983 [Bugula neritina]
MRVPVSPPAPLCKPPIPPEYACGPVPRFSEKPFWLPVRVPPNPENPGIDIYNEASADIQPYLERKYRHIQRVCTKRPSHRFNVFLNQVNNIEPTMVETITDSEQVVKQDVVYRRPRFSQVIQNYPEIKPDRFVKENVENTLAECFRQMRRGASIYADPCPIGMLRSERETLCWRLDLVERDVILGEGWKVFAVSVMSLDQTDLEMIDEFSCKYRCQVVEVVLDHWYKLFTLRSAKCLLPATKHSIIQVLHKLDKLDLLYHMGWQDE